MAVLILLLDIVPSSAGSQIGRGAWVYLLCLPTQLVLQICDLLFEVHVSTSPFQHGMHQTPRFRFDRPGTQQLVQLASDVKVVFQSPVLALYTERGSAGIPQILHFPLVM